MPDYSENTLVYYGPGDTIQNLRNLIINESGTFSFQNICPEPADQIDGIGSYAWRKENWSTKCDCEDVVIEDFTIDSLTYLCIKFTCPWNLPYNVLDTINKLFDNVYSTSSCIRENQYYKLTVGVFHPKKGCGIIYDEDPDCEYFDEITKTMKLYDLGKYKGYLNGNIYDEMMSVPGFSKSLQLLGLEDNRIENAERI
jgi:hypothetical protein